MRKLNLRKIITMGLIATSMLAVVPVGASAEWRQNSTGWWYSNGNGNYAKGWKNVNGSWYYFDNNGYMKTGWLVDENDDRKCYYLKSDGTMAVGQTMVDNFTFKFNSDGSSTDYLALVKANPTFNSQIAFDKAQEYFKRDIDAKIYDLGMAFPDLQKENGKKFYYVEKWRIYTTLADGECNLYGAAKVFEDGTIESVTKEQYIQTQYGKDRSDLIWYGNGITAEEDKNGKYKEIFKDKRA